MNSGFGGLEMMAGRGSRVRSFLTHAQKGIKRTFPEFLMGAAYHRP
jgi:hypothetical protein